MSYTFGEPIASIEAASSLSTSPTWWESVGKGVAASAPVVEVSTPTYLRSTIPAPTAPGTWWETVGAATIAHDVPESEFTFRPSYEVTLGNSKEQRTTSQRRSRQDILFPTLDLSEEKFFPEEVVTTTTTTTTTVKKMSATKPSPSVPVRAVSRSMSTTTPVCVSKSVATTSPTCLSKGVETSSPVSLSKATFTTSPVTISKATSTPPDVDSDVDCEDRAERCHSDSCNRDFWSNMALLARGNQDIKQLQAVVAALRVEVKQKSEVEANLRAGLLTNQDALKEMCHEVRALEEENSELRQVLASRLA